MGIKNFKLFLNALDYISTELTGYDSIFIDIQSYLYKAIDRSFKTNYFDLTQDVCIKVLNDLSALFYSIFSCGHFKDSLTVVICFDGAAPPLKLPTQRLRRSNTVAAEGRSLYKTLLFGHNILSRQVYNYIIQNLKTNCSNFFSNTNDIKIPSKLQFVVSGSHMRGEGEHRMFEFATLYKCKRPLIVSPDNDVFIIALSQFSKFDTIQIYKSAKIIWNVNLFATNYMPCSKECFIYASFLFGNDFIPAIIDLTERNCPVIHEALQMCERNHMPHIFFTILQHLITKSKLKFKTPHQIKDQIIEEFWKNIFWMLDYYSTYRFHQMYMENLLFDIFDKHQIIAVLLDLAYAERTFNKACLQYKCLKAEPSKLNPKNLIFTAEQLEKYSYFFPKSPIAENYHLICISVT